MNKIIEVLGSVFSNHPKECIARNHHLMNSMCPTGMIPIYPTQRRYK